MQEITRICVLSQHSVDGQDYRRLGKRYGMADDYEKVTVVDNSRIIKETVHKIIAEYIAEGYECISQTRTTAKFIKGEANAAQ